MKANTLAFLSFVTLVAMAVEFTNLIANLLVGTNRYELLERHPLTLSYTKPVTTIVSSINFNASAAWRRVSESFYDPSVSTPSGYVISKLTTINVAQKVPGTLQLSPQQTITTIFEGSPAPPTTIRNTVGLADTDVGNAVGTASTFLTDHDGITRKVVKTLSPLTFKVPSPDNVPSPFWARVTLVSETGQVVVQSHVVDYIGLTFTVSAPGSGLWSIQQMNFSR